MFEIKHLGLTSGKQKTVTFTRSMASDWMESQKMSPEKTLAMCANEGKVHDSAYEQGVVLPHNGELVRYLPLLANNGMAKDCEVLFAASDVNHELFEYCLGPLSGNTSGKRIAMNKLSVYMGLCFSSARPLSEVHPGCALNPGRVVILPEYYHKILVEKSLWVSPTGEKAGPCGFTVTPQENVTKELPSFDGVCFVRHTVLPRAATLRNHFFKGLGQPLDFEMMARVFGGTTVTDLWGNVYDLRDVDALATESVYKASSLMPWPEFAKGVGEFYIAVDEHSPKALDLSYQQVQTMFRSETEDAGLIIDRNRAHLSKYVGADNSHRLLSKTERLVAKMWPTYLQSRPAQLQMQERWTTLREDALSGKIKGVSTSHFLAPDPVAFWQYATGQEVRGMLNANEFACKYAKKMPKTKGISRGLITRNPHTCNANQVLRLNMKVSDRIFLGETLFTSINDDLSLWLRADYDGDHVNLCLDEDIIDVAVRSKEQDEKLGLFLPDWDAPKAPKVPITFEAYIGYLKNLTAPDQIGAWCAKLTRTWASLPQGYVWKIAACTYAANTAIDASKHGAGSFGQAKDYQWGEMAAVPGFYQHSPKYRRKVRNEQDVPPVCATHTAVDRASAILALMFPETYALPPQDEDFNPEILMENPKALQIAGLCKLGDRVAGMWENSGKFQEIAFRHSREWQALGNDNKNVIKGNWDEWQGELGRAELLKFAQEKYPATTIEHVADLCIRWVFTTKKRMSDRVCKTMVQTLFRLFGEIILRNVEHNLAMEADALFEQENAEFLAELDAINLSEEEL